MVDETDQGEPNPEAFERRVANESSNELADALAQIEQIALLRLKEILP